MTTTAPHQTPRTVLILGANGRFGRAAVGAFRAAGWQVRAFVRPGRTLPSDVVRIEGDAFQAADVAAAAQGADVIVHALNPPYTKWRTDLPRLAANVLAAARASGAGVMIPGNVYNYGAGMPAVLREDTAHRPTTHKGHLRETMEQSFHDAAAHGVHTVVLRAGDFIEAAQTGNWFDRFIAAKVDRGIAVYPGPRDRVHAWAYLPDMARAMVALAERAEAPSGFETFNFESYNVTGAQLIAALETATGKPLKVRGVPWGMMRLIALFAPMIREILEMRYLWQVPHALDGTRLQSALPDFRPTPLADCLQEVLPATQNAPAKTPSRASALA
ncbi:MAG: NAD(P)H-binding protein [Proteobacteria bacterium]|nr:NAD(P)H-binding protein [Pseudomonadota bacterium]MDA1059614.1 NAD(P)H-binding protein [Pseudomonadota bacterium]